MFKIIEPEVAGGLGPLTEIENNNVYPPKVLKLNYLFEGWLGDDIIEAFPCFIVTERLGLEIQRKALSGIQFDEVYISKSLEFEELYPNKKVPIFWWMKIIGSYLKDDFSLAIDYRLVISEKAFKVLQNFNVQNAEFEEIGNVPDVLF